MIPATNLGFPRIGPRRELKTALERYWAGELSEADLKQTGKEIRRQNWILQKQLGLTHVPSNDFSFYDHVLDTAFMVGAIPERYHWSDTPDLRTYFAMARGLQESSDNAKMDVPAMEMTKWLDTNYHYIVPEFEPDQKFRLTSTKPVDEFLEAKQAGVQTRPVLLGPVSFLLLGKSRHGPVVASSLLENLLPVYEDVLQRLAEAGAEWIQLDEPVLVLDLMPEIQGVLMRAYDRLSGISSTLKLLVATYFGDLRENLGTALHLPVAALHIDLVRAPGQLEPALTMIPRRLSLSLGLVDGRNVWRSDLDHALKMAEHAVDILGPDRVLIGPTCSLLHSPVDLDLERALDPELRSWLAFAIQKLEEIDCIARALNNGRDAVASLLKENADLMKSRRTSPRIHNQNVQQKLSSVTNQMLNRRSLFPIRAEIQKKLLALPPLPATTIGSFPQTREVRAVRAEFKSGKCDAHTYESFLKEEIERTIRFQEETGLDVLVHGEFERSDMVEYFGERLSGFAFTQNGWVQSYGSRCVRPPIIYGDVQRTKPMTVSWSRYAQSLTSKPVKGMLTGPVTILQWSFVRDDQPRSETARQIALAIREEVLDLEAAGIRIIQIDEPALREGLPLRRDSWQEYLNWAVNCFRLTSSGVRDQTQIHTHMCYSEFNDIMQAIAAMDADVIAIEASRSQMELLEVFRRYQYPNEIGPGVYDIHSPRVPEQSEIENLLRRAIEVIPATHLWVNPDCGLKTRRWEEVRPALQNMVEAARALRSTIS